MDAKKPSQQAHERTAFGQHKDGSYYLRASDMEDAGAIQDAAEAQGVVLAHRKSPAVHQGKKGVYSHFHFKDPADGQKVLEHLRSMGGQKADDDQPEDSAAQSESSPAETHIHVHVHQGEGREIQKAHVAAHTRKVNGKIVQVHEYDNEKRYAHRKQHIAAVDAGLQPLKGFRLGGSSDQAQVASYTAMNRTDDATTAGGHRRAADAHGMAANYHRQAQGTLAYKDEKFGAHHKALQDAHESASIWHRNAAAYFDQEGDPKKPTPRQLDAAGEPIEKKPKPKLQDRIDAFTEGEGKKTEAMPEQAIPAGHRPIVGGKVETESGRMIPAPPPLTGSPQSLKKQREWLKAQAIAEAEAKGDDWNARMFQNLNTKNWSQSDGDSASLYVFGEEDAKFWKGPAQAQNAKPSMEEKAQAPPLDMDSTDRGQHPWHFEDATHREVHSPDHFTYYRPSKAKPGSWAMNTVLNGKADPKAWMTTGGTGYKPGEKAEEHPKIKEAREAEAKEKAYFEANPDKKPKASEPNKDNWKPASGGLEKPFKARSGATLTYMHNEAKPGEHAYYLHGEDRILSNEEAEEHMGDRRLQDHYKLAAGFEGDREAAHPKAKEALTHATEAVGKLDTPAHSQAANAAFESTVKAAKSSHKANTSGSAADHLEARDDHYQASNDHAWAKQKATLSHLHERHDAAGRAHAEAGNHHHREYEKAHQTSIHEAIGDHDKANGGTKEAYEKAAAEAHKHTKGLELGGGTAPTAEAHYAAHEAHTNAARAARAHAETDPTYKQAAERHEKDAAWHKFLGDSKTKGREKASKSRKVAKSLDGYLANCDLLSASQKWHVSRLDPFNKGKKPHELPHFAHVQLAIKDAAHAGMDLDQVLDTIGMATGGTEAYNAAVLDWIG